MPFQSNNPPLCKTPSPKLSPYPLFIFRPKLTGTLDGAKPEGLICSDPRLYFENLACPAVIKG
jgi:hypothetical protein